MHAHLYACEGAYFLGVLYEQEQAVEAALRGTATALKIYRQTGYLPPALPAIGTTAERSDTLAQLLRLAILLQVGSRDDHVAISARLLRYQDESSGALYLGRDFDPAHEEVRCRMGHASNHSTLFAVQAWLCLVDPKFSGTLRRHPWLFA
jgi:hypothetical protein